MLVHPAPVKWLMAGAGFQGFKARIRADSLEEHEVVHIDDLFGAPVSLDFRFHLPVVVVEALRSAQLAVVEHVESEPYEVVEYPSRRCERLFVSENTVKPTPPACSTSWGATAGSRPSSRGGSSDASREGE